MIEKMSYRLVVSLIALILASTSSFATKVSSANVPPIFGDEDLNELSTQVITVERMQVVGEKGRILENSRPIVQSYSLGRATRAALDEAQWMQEEVLKSPALVLPIDFNHHKEWRFDQKMREAYPEFKWDEYDRFLKNDLSCLFYNLQNHLAKQQNSNNWKKTNVKNVMVSFGRNTKGDLIVYLDPLKVGLPVYEDQRLAKKESFTPQGVILSQKQQDSINFLLHVMCLDSSRLMDMVSYRSYHPEESLADAQYFFQYGKQRALELPPVIQNKVEPVIVQIPVLQNNRYIPVGRILLYDINAYKRYFWDTLPQLGDSFRAYNVNDPKGHQMVDDEIVSHLFKVGTDRTPSREDAISKFRDLKERGRPYAVLFQPPRTPYEDYFEFKFLPSFVKGFKDYNKADVKVKNYLSNNVLKARFPSLHSGDFMPRNEALKFFGEMSDPFSRSYRAYAVGFNPPYTSKWIGEDDTYKQTFERNLPLLVEGFNAYNTGNRYFDYEVMKMLFNVNEGEFPSQDMFMRDFSQRAHNGRPYASKMMSLKWEN